MSESRRRMLIAYDVGDDRRRDRLAVALQYFGERIQFSVFMVDGKPADFVRLRRKIEVIIDPEIESVLLCDLGERTAAQRLLVHLGRQRDLVGDDDALIV